MAKKQLAKQSAFDKTVAESNFNFVKNFKWFIIAPILIIIVGIVLLFTVGFNLGFDFTGGSSVKIYANYYGRASSAQTYDVSNSADLAKMLSKVESVLGEYNLKVSSFGATTMDIYDQSVYGEDAVEVKYQLPEGLTTDDATSLNAQVQAALASEFEYTGDWSVAVSDVTILSATADVSTALSATLAIALVVLVVLLYAGLRFDMASGFTALVVLFVDALVAISLSLICQVTINANFIAAVVATLAISAINVFALLSKIHESRTKGGLGTLANEKIASTSAKQTVARSSIVCGALLVVLVLVALIGTSAVRSFALVLILGTLSSFYTSLFVAPALWAVGYKPRKKKKVEVTAEP